VPLDDVGHAQARSAAPLLAALRPAAVWSSDLARAAETAAYVAEVCGLPVTLDARLREFDVGERQGLTWAESVDRFPWIAGGVGLGERLAGVPGAESDADVSGRIVPALEEAAEAVAPGETALVVSHGAALKLGIAGLLGWDEAAARALVVLDNCHWSTILVPSDRSPRRLVDYGVGDFASPEGVG
jgi:probable phosphoglycerate mutase